MDIEKIFGENTFGLMEMKSRLPKETYRALQQTIEQGAELDPAVADAVALAMKEWAIERGATHFSHWFHPLTGQTAEKHDSFITPNVGGGAVAEFSGKDLIQGEPDASSFPSGGLRATFEARGYTAWDPDVAGVPGGGSGRQYLAIPDGVHVVGGRCAGHEDPAAALDARAGAAGAAGAEAVRCGDVAGEHDARPGAGVLPDRPGVLLPRPDLVACGRTLFGAKPPRGQELEDHYFGAIEDRVLACMMDVERELYRLGVPVKTRHNEVAPGQFEVAPIYENANIAADHQQLLMLVLRKTARKYGLVALLHEKPFAGRERQRQAPELVVRTESQNLLEPGDDPHDEHAVPVLLHGGAAGGGAAPGPGARGGGVRGQRPPPRRERGAAGHHLRVPGRRQLTEVFEQLEKPGRAKSRRRAACWASARPCCQAAEACGRPQPDVALRVHRQQVRVPRVGASQSISFPATVLNTIVPSRSTRCVHRLEAELKKKGASLEEVLQKRAVREVAKCKRIIFNGDGYSSDWHDEAERRGLLNLPTPWTRCPGSPMRRTWKLFEKYGVLSRASWSPARRSSSSSTSRR
jgi:glutamine synthetase